MISLLLLFLSGIFDASRDLIGFRYEQSIFYKFNPYFWNPQKSWRNKYDKDLSKSKECWYYFGLYKPLFKERFPFSTTFLVFLTDGWHLLKALVLTCWVLAIVFYKPMLNIWGDMWLLFIFYSSAFNIFETKLFNRTYWKYRK